MVVHDGYGLELFSFGMSIVRNGNGKRSVITAVCPLLAQSGHPKLHRTCPLSGVQSALDRASVALAPVPQ
jgi:hypothetical protein